MSDEHDLREVPVDTGSEPERLQESVLADIATGVGAIASVGALHYTRGQYHLMRDERDADRAAFAAQVEADRRALEVEYRRLVAQSYGLDALDRLDGFEVDTEPFYGFAVD